MESIIPVVYTRSIQNIHRVGKKRDGKSAWRPFKPNHYADLKNSKSQTFLRIITLNVWFDVFMQKERFCKSIDNILSLDADLIALQECTHTMLQRLANDRQVREKYIISDLTGRGFKGFHGVVLLITKVRADILLETMEIVPFPVSKSRRYLLLAHLFVNGKKLVFGTSHFESNPQDEEIRKSQFQFATELFTKKGNYSLLSADFNITFDERESGLLESLGWIDACTDTTLTTFNTYKPDKEKKRLDRVLYQGEGIKFEHFSHFGKVPLVTDSKGLVFASDHLGVFVKLKL